MFLFVCMCRCDHLCGIILFSGNYSSEGSACSKGHLNERSFLPVKLQLLNTSEFVCMYT